MSCLPGMPCYGPEIYAVFPKGCCNPTEVCPVNSDIVIYSGPNLPNTGINTNNSLTLALQKIDEAISPEAILEDFLAIIQSNVLLRAAFCALVNECTGITTTTTTSTSSTTTTTTTTVFPYTIGDAYEGGTLAYILGPGDPGYDAMTAHGLVATVADISAGAAWGCYATPISGADGTAIGTGNQNTIDIMAGCITAGIAARLCGNLIEGGYNDWYLPSKDELNKLYLNQVAIGGFTSVYYWSSSEASANDAWAQYLPTGYQEPQAKINTNSIRAIRSF